MTAHHFFTDPEAMTDAIVTLHGEEARHAARVLRVRAGEAITVSDGAGRVVDAVVTRTEDVVEARICRTRRIEPVRPVLTLYQALVKGDRFDDVVEKATEVGVARIVPFVAERSVVRWDERKQRRAVERWRAITKAAAKQSHAPFLTSVEDVAADVTVAGRHASPVIVLHESEEAEMLRDRLPDERPELVAIVVGPEGGLTDTEVEQLTRGGARAAGLGPRILRTETAGLVAASIVGYVYGNLG